MPARPDYSRSPTSRQSYMSNTSSSTQSTALTDLWEASYNPGWRVSKIGERKNFNWGRPGLDRASTELTVPDEFPRQVGDGKQKLSEVKEEGWGVVLGSEVDMAEGKGDDDNEVTVILTSSQTTIATPALSSIEETPSPLPDRNSFEQTPRKGSRTSHIAATLSALESRSSPRASFSSTTEQSLAGEGGGMKSSPSIMALRTKGGIKDRISWIESSSPPSNKLFTVEPLRLRKSGTPSQVGTDLSHFSKNQESPTLQRKKSLGILSDISHTPTAISSFEQFITQNESTDTHSTTRSELSTVLSFSPKSPRQRISPPISMTETFESFRIDSYYGRDSSSNADIGDLGERFGDVRIGSLVTTPSGNLIHLPATGPLNLRRSAGVAVSPRVWVERKEMVEKEARESLESGETVEESGLDVKEDAGTSERSTDEMDDFEPTKVDGDSHDTIQKSTFKSNRVPPPLLSPRTAATATFKAPVRTNERTAAWIGQTSPLTRPSPSASHSNLAASGKAKAMIDRFENKQGIVTQDGIRSLPTTPTKLSGMKIGLGTPSSRIVPHTDVRIGSGMRGELAYPGSGGNKDKPLPLIHPASQNIGLKPPPRTWTRDDVVIPVSPPRMDGKHGSHSVTDRSPLSANKPKSRSPMKEILGKLQGVGKKVKSEVGRRRAGTIEKLSGSSSWRGDRSYAGSQVDVFGSRNINRTGENEAQHGLGHGVGVAQSVMSGSSAIVHDRMGDEEMGVGQYAHSLPELPTRESSGFFLLPPPCSTDGWIGNWISGEISLVAKMLHMTSEATRDNMVLDMGDCLDIISIKKEDATNCSLPAIESLGEDIEIIGLSFADRSRRYLAFDGLANRLGWISALWGAITLHRPNAPMTRTTRLASSSTVAPPKSVLSESPFAKGLQSSGPLVIRNRDATPNSVSTFRIASNSTPKASPRLESALRHSVQDMFNVPVPSPGARYSIYSGIARTDREPADYMDAGSVIARDFAAAPAERDLSLFSRSKSLRRARQNNTRPDNPTREPDTQRSEVDFSFDENDLNPSRSASQRGARYDETYRDIPSSPTPRSVMRSSRKGSSIRIPGRPLPIPVMPVPLAATPSILDSPGSVTTARPLPSSPTPRSQNTIADLAPPSASDSQNSLLSTPNFSVQSLEKSPIISINSTLKTEMEESLHDSPHEPAEKPPTEFAEARMETQPVVAIDLQDIRARLDEQIEAVRAHAAAIYAESKAADDRVEAVRAQTEAVQALEPALGGKLDQIQLDIRDLQNSFQLSSLVASKEDPAPPVDLQEVHSKLDGLLAIIEKGSTSKTASEDPTLPLQEETPVTVSGTPPSTAALTSVLPISESTEVQPDPALAELGEKIHEVLGVVQELQAARQAQTTQSADMAKYLGQLNEWLEKFVTGTAAEMQSVSAKVERLVSELAPEAPAVNEETSTPAALGIASLMNEVHALMIEQKKRSDEDASIASRVDTLVNTMVEDRNAWTSSLEQIRTQNEHLLRAVASDLTSEIRGERLRFVEAMREATSVNVALHVEEFKNMLNTEVTRNMQELAQMREQKRTLEMQISDYFAIIAKTKGFEGAGASPMPAAPMLRTPGLKSPLPRPPA